eukprot:13314070-Alexandrium_andersonii.AAC.1
MGRAEKRLQRCQPAVWLGRTGRGHAGPPPLCLRGEIARPRRRGATGAGENPQHRGPRRCQ